MFLTELFSADALLLEGQHDKGQFKALFVIGSPGSGKNTVAKLAGVHTMGLKEVDLDFTKGALQLMTNKPVTYDEAWPLHVKRRDLLLKQGLGVVIFTTGRNFQRVSESVNDFKRLGYDTAMLFVDIDYAMAFDNVQKRQAHDADIGSRGRQVSDDFLNTAYNQIEENVDKFARLFGRNFFHFVNDAPGEAALRHKVLKSKLPTTLQRFISSPTQTLKAA